MPVSRNGLAHQVSQFAGTLRTSTYLPKCVGIAWAAIWGRAFNRRLYTGKRDAYIQQLSTELVLVQQTLRQCQNMLRMQEEHAKAPSPQSPNNADSPRAATHDPAALPSHSKPMHPSAGLSSKSSASLNLMRMANGAMIDASLLRQTLGAGDSASQLASVCHPATSKASHDAQCMHMDTDHQSPWTM